MASCERCTQGQTLPGEPTGTMTTSLGCEAYLASAQRPGEESTSHGPAIVLFTDAFGLPLVNSKILADNLCQKLGCDVWVPDIFNGAR
jgi:carboxymethylenebutenolidase